MTAEQALDAVHDLLSDPDGIADNMDLMVKLKNVEIFLTNVVHGNSTLSAPRVPWPEPTIIHVANLAHSGGLVGMNQTEVLQAIRRLTLPFWSANSDRNDLAARVHDAIDAARPRGGEAK